jgi:hypothetical protein
MSLAADMRACEEALLHGDFADDMVALDRLLAPEFVEVGSNGRVSERAQVVGWLLRKDPAARWALDDLLVHEIAHGVRLVRYRAKQILPEPAPGNGALHSSIWCFNREMQCWQLRFHQATKPG